MALVVTCSGAYGVGSKGKPDARAIIAEIAKGLSATKVDSVLLDYTDLIYEWGDDIGATFYPDDPTDRDRVIPTAVIVGNNCKNAIQSLLESDLGFDSWLESGFIFFSKDAAEKYLSFEIRNTQQGAPEDAPKAARP